MCFDTYFYHIALIRVCVTKSTLNRQLLAKRCLHSLWGQVGWCYRNLIRTRRRRYSRHRYQCTSSPVPLVCAALSGCATCQDSQVAGFLPVASALSPRGPLESAPCLSLVAANHFTFFSPMKSIPPPSYSNTEGEGSGLFA